MKLTYLVHASILLTASSYAACSHSLSTRLSSGNGVLVSTLVRLCMSVVLGSVEPLCLS